MVTTMNRWLYFKTRLECSGVHILLSTFKQLMTHTHTFSGTHRDNKCLVHTHTHEIPKASPRRARKKEKYTHDCLTRTHTHTSSSCIPSESAEIRKSDPKPELHLSAPLLIDTY